MPKNEADQILKDVVTKNEATTEGGPVEGATDDMRKYQMPEGMKIVTSKPKVTKTIKKEVSQEVNVKKFLDSVYNKQVPKRDVGVIMDGTVDEAELSIVHARAKRVIQQQITKLYQKKIKKVAIIGTAMTCKDAPYSDPSWEIWGLNDHWNIVPRATRWFEANNGACRTSGRIEWLKKAPIPVYMEDHYEDIPMSIKYPFDEINDWV